MNEVKQYEKFSVLMSVYYKEKPENLKLALDSVINQTLVPNEIVIVEDGPLTQELYNVVEKYLKKYNIFKIIKIEKNNGLGIALNEGLKHCTYNYVARMDSDDICVNTRFEKQMSFLIKNPNIDAVGSNMIEFNENMENIVSEKIVPEYSEEINKYLKKRNPMNHPTVIYKRNKVLEVNGYEDYQYFEDYYLWAKMINNGCKFYNIQENLYKFRAGASMIKRRGGKKYLKYIKNFEKGLLNLKIINKKIYILNLIKRYIISILPDKLREIFYKNILR